MNIKVLVLDSDGVVNPFPKKKFSDRFLEEYPWDSHVMEFFSSWSYWKCRRWETCVKQELPLFLNSTNWTLEAILDYWHHWDNWVDEKMLELLKVLKKKNIPVYLATNQAKCRTDYMIETMWLDENVFNRIVASCDYDMQVEKPDIIFYKKLYNIIENNYPWIKPHEIIFFDDKQDNVDSANKFWIKSFLYSDYDDFIDTIKQYNLI